MIAHYLQKIRDISDPFDLSQIGSYKETQQELAKRPKAFIELEAQKAATLGDITMRLFGTDAADRKQLSTVGDRVLVSILIQSLKRNVFTELPFSTPD